MISSTSPPGQVQFDPGCISRGEGSGDFFPDKELCDTRGDLPPVTEHRNLIIPERHASDFFDRHRSEIDAMYALVGEIKERVETLDMRLSSLPQQEREDSSPRSLVLEFCGGRLAMYQLVDCSAIP